MTISVDDTTVAAFGSSANDFDGNALTATSASFTPPSGCLLVLELHANEASANQVNSSAVVTSGLTWTKRSERGSAINGGAANTEGWVSTWTAPVTTGAAMTVAATIGWQDNFSDYSIRGKVYIVTGQAASPIGATGSGGPTSGDNLSPNLLTATGAGRVFYGGTERNGASGSAGVSTSTDTEDAAYIAADVVGFISVYKAADHSAGAGTIVGNLDASATTIWNWAALEILAATGGVNITNADDESFFNGETGVVITGSGFGASQGSGKVYLSPTNNVADGARVEQTVTAWGATSITISVVKGGLSFDTNLYLFVVENGGTSNSPGYVVQINARAYVRENLIDLTGASVNSLASIIMLVWRTGTGPSTGAPNPDEALTVSTNGSGQVNQQITRGALVINDPVWIMLLKNGSPAKATARKITPVYE